MRLLVDGEILHSILDAFIAPEEPESIYFVTTSGVLKVDYKSVILAKKDLSDLWYEGRLELDTKEFDTRFFLDDEDDCDCEEHCNGHCLYEDDYE